MKSNHPHPTWLFLFSNGNLVGCILGFLGLGLYYLGFTGQYWFLVVMGLYGIGVLVIPPGPFYEFLYKKDLVETELQREFGHFLEWIYGKLPDEASQKTASIISSVLIVLPQLKENRRVKKPNSLIQQIAKDYLPALLIGYMNLPPVYANFIPLKRGKTPRRLLMDQLTLVDLKLKDIILAVYQDDNEKIQAECYMLEKIVSLFSGYD